MYGVHTLAEQLCITTVILRSWYRLAKLRGMILACGRAAAGRPLRRGGHVATVAKVRVEVMRAAAFRGADGVPARRSFQRTRGAFFVPYSALQVFY